MPDAEEDQIDGRTARRDRNRDAVLDATLDLFREDAMFPAPADVAARSGVSTRSVQRYFPDMDALLRAAIGRHLERVDPLFAVADLGEGPLADRIARLVHSRVTLHDAVAPMVRAALIRRSNELIVSRLRERRLEMRDQVVAMFAPELDALDEPDRSDVAEGLDLLLGFDALEHLRARRDLDADRAEAVLRRAVTSLLADPRTQGV